MNSLKLRIKNKLNHVEKEPNVVVMATEIKGKNPQGKMKMSKSVLKKKTSFNSESWIQSKLCKRKNMNNASFVLMILCSTL